MRELAFAVVASLGVSGKAAAQAPPAEVPRPPVFAVGLDVVAVDASVVDGDGRPGRGRGPAPKPGAVDGRPRRHRSGG